MRGTVIAAGLSVAGAVILAVLAWVFLPLKNKLEPTRMRITSDHGIKLQVLSSQDDMQGIPPAEMLGLSSEWLFGPSYYFPEGPHSEPAPSGSPWWHWAKQHGAEGVYYTHIMLRLQATQDRTVVVGTPYVRVRREPARLRSVMRDSGNSATRSIKRGAAAHPRPEDIWLGVPSVLTQIAKPCPM